MPESNTTLDVTRQMRAMDLSENDQAVVLSTLLSIANSMGLDIELRFKPKIGRPSNLSRMLQRQSMLDLPLHPSYPQLNFNFKTGQKPESSDSMGGCKV